jgi:hypothetical protein
MSALALLVLTCSFALQSVLGSGTGEDGLTEIELRPPGKDWAIRVAPPEFEFGAPQTAEDGKTVWAAGDGLEPGFMMTVMVESSPPVADLAACVARFEEKIGLDSLKAHHIKRTERAGMPAIEYELPEHAGVRIDQRHLHAYLFRDGVCAEFHLSMLNSRGQHDRLFRSALRSISIVDVRTGSEESGDAGVDPTP